MENVTLQRALSGSSRRLRVDVHLQYICEEVQQQQQLQWSGTLAVFDKQLKHTGNMERTHSSLAVADDVDKQPTDTLDLRAVIKYQHRSSKPAFLNDCRSVSFTVYLKPPI